MTIDLIGYLDNKIIEYLDFLILKKLKIKK